MLHVAHQSRLNAPDKDGTPARAHHEGAVRRARIMHGARSAQYAIALAKLEALQGPDIPEPLEYLHERFATLDGMRSEGMSGTARLTPESIRAANELFGWHLTPREVHALRMMDAATRAPMAFIEPESGDG